MTEETQIRKENDFLLRELGTKPLYAWKHSKTLHLRIQKITESDGGVKPEWDYYMNQATGIIELQPVYIDMPMLPRTPDSWLLCRYVEADQEAIFRQRFGARIAYPAGGIWQPIEETALRPGIIPDRQDTINMIEGVKANREAVRRLFDEADDREERRAKSDKALLSDMIRDRLTAQMEVPGKLGGTSFFNARPSDTVGIKKEVVQ